MSEVEICQLAYAGNLDILRVKIEEKRELCGKPDQSGRQPIHWAASGGHTHVVEYLLNSCEVNHDAKDETNWTPLMIAASAGREQIVRDLIAKGASTNAVNTTGQCPLHYAASKDRYDIAELLLEHSAEPNTSDWMDNTPLHRAASKGHMKLTKLLVSYNADPNHQDKEGNTPLHLACEDEQTDVAKFLVENGAEKTPLDVADLGLRRQLERLSDVIPT